MPLALDTYFRGNSHELAFCQRAGAGGNHLVATTAGGQRLGGDQHLKLRQEELAPILNEYRRLAADQRKPQLEDPAQAVPPQRPVPEPPPGGLILRGYCTYVDRDEDGRVGRVREFYYRENPDCWAAETQSDTAWLTGAEWQSLVPAEPRAGQQLEVAEPIRRRLFSTIGIDYMEGSVNSLPTSEAAMTLTVQEVAEGSIALRLDGYGRMGKPYDESARWAPHSRGCELRVLGRLSYDRRRQAFDRFDVVGVGQAWGNKMEYTRREIRLDRHPWMYGVAWELVTGEAPIDRLPPYNLLHYGSGGAYFDAAAK